jgi:DNA mismatch repair protein MutS
MTECGERELAGWLARLNAAEAWSTASRCRRCWRSSRHPASRSRTGPPGNSTPRSASASCASSCAWPEPCRLQRARLACAHAAAAALLSYAEHTQGQALAHVRTLTVERASDLLDLPPSTHRNLELTQTLRGDDSPTLLSLLDTCRTGMGSRALRHWLTHPLRERTVAMQRHDAIEVLIAARSSRCARRCATSATSSASPRASRCARCGRAS